MAAYGALVSVMQIIDQIQLHPRPPISLDQNQVASLTQIITFLQNFLERYNPHRTYTVEADPLESRIAEAAYAAEDVIESYIVDHILARSTNNEETISSDEFYQGLQKVIEEMDFIKMVVVEMEESNEVQDRIHITNSVIDTSSSRSTSTAHKVSMVGFEDVLYQMLEKLTNGRRDLEIIPIVGMGGIGKTTLARNFYKNPLVEEYFDVCAWSTISQEYSSRNILREAFDQINKTLDQENKWYKESWSDDELGEQLYKNLIGRRYLIVMDDMWSMDAWYRVRRFYPNNENGSRIVITTRLTKLASQLTNSNNLEMRFLDEASSWDLFSKTVFGDEICPLELESVGKKIVNGCKGLPLSIVVIGGLLSKTERILENWDVIAHNLASVVNLEDNESCLQILYMSYNNLPVHIKPCFLYMGLFPEDVEMKAFLTIMLLVADGLLKPCHGKSLEEIGEDYLEELVDRNLILVEERYYDGKLTTFKIHDLLRDLSLREAQKVKFLCVLGEESIPNISQGINSQRRIVSTLPKYPPTPILESLESASLVRALAGKFPKTLSTNFRLLRVSYLNISSAEDLLRLVNLRLFTVNVDEGFLPRIPASVSFLWNLQTICLSDIGYDYIFEIWKMPQLKNIMTGDGTLDGAYSLPDHPLDGDMHIDEFVLNNLQRLVTVSNLNIGEWVVKRIPNIKRLKLYYDEFSTIGGDYCLYNLCYLQRLESLNLRYSDSKEHTLTQLVTFPNSLKKLTLEETKLHWEEIKTKIGPLPSLHYLQLKANSFVGSEWETFEDQFCSLRFLFIDNCKLEYWKTYNTHFPRLEHLILANLSFLNEIPLCIGDIPTLESIILKDCSDYVNDSAQRIQEEQEELGNEGFHLHVVSRMSRSLKSSREYDVEGDGSRSRHDGDRRGDDTNGRSIGLWWYKDLGQHVNGEFSMAVIQATNPLEDQSQHESGPLSFLDSGPRGTFVGVYDGHGGPEAARFVKQTLFNNLKKLASESEEVSADVIRNAFLATEEEFLSIVRQQWSTNPQIASTGTCCLVGVICNGLLYVANAGDSRAVLGRADKSGRGVTAVQLSTEHNASLKSIRDELRSLHSDDPQIVVRMRGLWRIKGIITVSRSIGDAYLKRSEFNRKPLLPKFRLPEPFTKPILGAEPSILVQKLNPEDHFLVFASDGLWEHVSNQEAVDIVYSNPRNGVARRLVRLALQRVAKKRSILYKQLHRIDADLRRHFHDDITVVVIFIERGRGANS